MYVMMHITAHGVENAIIVYTSLTTKKKQKLDLFTGGFVETAFLNQRISITGNSLGLEIQQYRKE